MPFQIKRIYDDAKPADGIRVLVDRLWPRGLKKTDAHLEHWMKDVAPTAGLRTWFGHKPERFAEFRRRYRKELAVNLEVATLRKLGKGRRVTLLYSASDPENNQAQVLLAVLQGKTAKKKNR